MSVCVYECAYMLERESVCVCVGGGVWVCGCI